MFRDNGRGVDNISLSKDIFRNYAERDLKLTDAGLEAIRTVIPEFEEIDMDAIGIKEYTAYCRNWLPGGRTDLTITEGMTSCR